MSALGVAVGVRVEPDRCPGVLALHEAADGHVARVRLPGGRVSATQLRVLADAAGTLGSDLVEVTARGNLQLRGLAGGDGPRLAALLASAGLLPSIAHERARTLLAGPWTGPVGDALLDTLDAGLCADPMLAALPGRFCFAVDDGSGGVDVPAADVALVLDTRGDRADVVVGGVLAERGVSVAEAVGIALDLARVFVLRGNGAWRVRELPAGAASLGVRGPRWSGPPPEAVGPGVRSGATTAVVPLGRLDGAQLRGLAALADVVRVSPWRTVTVPRPRVAARLEALGLPVRDAAGWTGLTACAGLGHCARALGDTQAVARRRAGERSAGAPREHIAGCERRCGAPSAADAVVHVLGVRA